MNYLVTGGTGLIGSRIVRDLVREGHKVVVYDWDPSFDSLERVLDVEEIKSGMKVVRGDVTDLRELSRVLKNNKVEIVIHTASLLTLESNSDPINALRINCEGTLCVFELAKRLGLKKIVWSSSNAAFGPPCLYADEFIPNNAPKYPQDVYGATKSFNEDVAGYYIKHHGLDITGIRYMNVYGGGGQQGGFFGPIVRELIINPALGKRGKVPYGDALLGWSYVDDPARASVMASKVSKPKTGTFSIMGDVRSVRDAAKYVRKILPDVQLDVLAGGVTAIPVKFDTTPIEIEIGYYPEWSMERGLKETINLVRFEHGLSAI